MTRSRPRPAGATPAAVCRGGVVAAASYEAREVGVRSAGRRCRSTKDE